MSSLSTGPRSLALPGPARLKAGLQGRGSSTAMPELWITWSWGVSPISASNVIGELGDTDSLSVSFVPDTLGYFIYILSINPPRDWTVNIIPILQMRKQVQTLTRLGQGHMSNNSRVSFQTKVCWLQNLFLSNVSHCFQNRGRSPRILREMKKHAEKRLPTNIHWAQEIPTRIDKILLSTHKLSTRAWY